jgi:nucleoside recognition membrane protein YjiH
MLSETFWMFLISSLIGLILKMVSSCYKSKCKSFDCLGISIIRDVVIEEKFDEVELNKTNKELNKTKSDTI